MFFQTHAELVLPNGNEGPLENETDFGHALSQIGSKKNMEYVVNTWTEELGLNEEDVSYSSPVQLPGIWSTDWGDFGVNWSQNGSMGAITPRI